MSELTRREILATLAAAGLITAASPSLASLLDAPIHTRKIPKTGEVVPTIGMGTWITFNVGKDIQARDARSEVLNTFFELGGKLVDSSPMYGSAEEVVGYCLKKTGKREQLFSATKVWSPFTSYGNSQISNSYKLWGEEQFDLIQVHNLVSWQSHLQTLFQLKADKKLRYVGITTSHGLRHEEIENIMKTQPIDFIQLTYNVLDRDPEKRILPLAKEKQIAVIINRPFQRGDLFDSFASKPLPDWASEIDCTAWSQFFLKFVTSHPAVTCAIPATSQVAHMKENMAAARGRLPDQKMRQKMTDYIRAL
ncbi:MAG: aldo/keto reductase [Methyloligellaceae bacterium]